MNSVFATDLFFLMSGSVTAVGWNEMSTTTLFLCFDDHMSDLYFGL